MSTAFYGVPTSHLKLLKELPAFHSLGTLHLVEASLFVSPELMLADPSNSSPLNDLSASTDIFLRPDEFGSNLDILRYLKNFKS